MEIELRSDNTLHVSGYVNAVERDSRVLPAGLAHGADTDFVEQVAAGAFSRAISKNPDIRMMFNHTREIGSVKGGQLTLREDNIGLYADAVITDTEVINAARHGELRGWSFGFTGAKAVWEQVNNGLKRRFLTDFDLDEVSLLTKTPAYIGTSVETRSEELRAVERRVTEDGQPPVTEGKTAVSADFYTKTIEYLGGMN